MRQLYAYPLEINLPLQVTVKVQPRGVSGE